MVWQQAVDVAAAAYRCTRAWPKEELYGLTSQARRAATSVPANIAEGYGRERLGSHLQFLKIAQGSLKELETLLLLAQRVRIANDAPIGGLLERANTLGKVLRG